MRLAVQACRLTPGFRTIAGRPRYAPRQCSTASSSVLPRRSGGTGLVPISVGAGSAARNRTLVIVPWPTCKRCGLAGVITQNVDGLHSAAGSRRVINLHGDIASVVCLECGDRSARSELQSRLASANPQLEEPRVLEHAELRPDGDAVVQDWRQFRLVGCRALRRAAQTRCRVLRRVRAQATSRGSVRAHGACGDLGGIGLVTDRDVRVAFRPAQREASATGSDHQSRSDTGRRVCQPEDRSRLFGNAD